MMQSLSKLSIDNGWSGGQYSLFRFAFGTYLFIHFAQLVPWGPELFSSGGMFPDASASPIIYAFPNVLGLFDPPLFVQGLLALAAVLAVLFALGIYDRPVAIGIWYVWACIFGRNPLIANPGIPYVGWMLLAHAFLPPAPYGSWPRRSLADPGSAWRMPPSIFAVAWLLMAIGYSYSGITKLVSPSWVDGTAILRVLDNPLSRPGLLHDLMIGLPVPLLRALTYGTLALEILFAPLAIFKRARPILWASMLGMHLGLMLLIDFADLSLGMVMLHLFTFNPDWIPAKRAALATGAGADGVAETDATSAHAHADETRAPGTPAPELIFYDGHCGLCHRAVRFALSEDRSGTAFRFAPLQGETFLTAVPESERAALPDSIVVQTADGQLLTRSSSIIYIAKRFGGAWRLGAILAQWVPSILRDSGYSFVAAVRHRLFRRPDETCPLLPPDLRRRFDP